MRCSVLSSMIIITKYLVNLEGCMAVERVVRGLAVAWMVLQPSCCRSDHPMQPSARIGAKTSHYSILKVLVRIHTRAIARAWVARVGCNQQSNPNRQPTRITCIS